jgi:hypothetical protein
MFCSYFAYSEWTPGEGPNGSDWTLRDYDSYEEDALDPKRWGGWTGPGGYGTICRDGKAVCTLGADADGLTVNVPEDAEDITNEEFAEIMGGTSVRGTSNPKSDFSLKYKAGKITFSLTASSYVRIALYTLNGQLVQTVEDSKMDAGFHSSRVNQSALPAGTYVLSLNTENLMKAQRVITIAR